MSQARPLSLRPSAISTLMAVLCAALRASRASLSSFSCSYRRRRWATYAGQASSYAKTRDGSFETTGPGYRALAAITSFTLPPARPFSCFLSSSASFFFFSTSLLFGVSACPQTHQNS